MSPPLKLSYVKRAKVRFGGESFFGVSRPEFPILISRRNLKRYYRVQGRVSLITFSVNIHVLIPGVARFASPPGGARWVFNIYRRGMMGVDFLPVFWRRGARRPEGLGRISEESSRCVERSRFYRALNILRGIKNVVWREIFSCSTQNGPLKLILLYRWKRVAKRNFVRARART